MAMNLFPFLAQDGELVGQPVLDPAYLAPTELVALPQFRWSGRAIENEHRFAARSYYVDMLRPMISRVNGHPQPIET
jgi:hypothetical protein